MGPAMKGTNVLTTSFMALIAYASACQIVANIEPLKADPLSSSCALPATSGAAARVRIANLVPSATNADFCIRPSGTSDWGRPVLRNGGTAAACQAGLAYANVSAPFGVASASIDVKTIAAGGPCSQAATSELDGIKLGPGVTTIARMGGGSAKVSERTTAFAEETTSDMSDLRIRVVNAMPGGPDIEIGIAKTASQSQAATITLPAEVSTILVTRPVSFGQVESNGPTTTPPYVVDKQGYMSFDYGGFPFVLVPANQTKAAIAWYQIHGGFTKTMYAIGDPANLGYPVRGLYCDDLAPAPGNALLDDCTLTDLPTLAVDTFDTALYGANASYEGARKPFIYKAVQGDDADLLCLLWTSEPDANENFVAALKTAGMGYVLNPQAQLATPPTDPTNWNGKTPPPTLPNPPCAGSVPPSDFTDAFQCAVNGCNTDPGSETGTIQGPLTCLTSNCTPQLIPLFTTYPICLNCLIFNITSLQTYVQTKQNCTVNTAYPITAGGANSSILASRYPFASNPDGSPATDVYYLPSTEARLSVLHARVLLNPDDAADTVDFFCGQFTTPSLIAALPYTGNYSNGRTYPDEPTGTNGWRDEQNLQATRTTSWVQKVSGGRPAIVAGVWSASAHYPTSTTTPSAATPWTIGDQSPEVVQQLETAFTAAHAPGWSYPCTSCPSTNASGPPNVYGAPPQIANVGGFDEDTTYVTGAGLGSASVTDESLLYTDDVVQFDPTNPQRLGPITEVWGRRLRIIRPSAAPTQ
jgi:hypothetical protein